MHEKDALVPMKRTLDYEKPFGIFQTDFLKETLK